MTLSRILLVVLVLSTLGCAAKTDVPDETASSTAVQTLDQTASPAAPMDQDRKAQLEANLKHQLRFQLQGQSVTVTSLGPSDFGDLDRGTFVIGQQSFSFLTTHDDRQFFVLATPPFDAGLSQAEIENELEADRVARAQQAREIAGILSEATNDLPYRGAENAAVLIVEFSDFQCPYCKVASETVEQVLEDHGEDVKFVYAHFPLDNHPWAMPAAIAAVCAADQKDSAHWALHDFFFANQDAISTDNVISKSKQALSGEGIDLVAWERCATDTGSDAYADAAASVNASFQLGRQMGVSGTPGFFVNGVFANGAIPFETFVDLIENAQNGTK